MVTYETVGTWIGQQWGGKLGSGTAGINFLHVQSMSVRIATHPIHGTIIIKINQQTRMVRGRLAAPFCSMWSLRHPGFLLLACLVYFLIKSRRTCLDMVPLTVGNHRSRVSCKPGLLPANLVGSIFSSRVPLPR